MLNNYYILKELANHLDKELSYFKISGCFSQEKDQLVISFSKDGNTKYLLFSCIRNNSSLLLRDNYSKAKQNTATLFQSLKEISVSKIFIDISDRLIYFKTENNLNLICSFASGKENFFITDNNIILESFKENSALKGTSLNNHFLFQPATIPESGTVKEYFKNKYIRFGKSYFKEISFRLKITLETVLNDTLKSNVDTEFLILLDRFCTPEFIIYTNQNDMIMSLTPLEYYENSYKKIQFENIIDLISEFYKRKQKQKFLTNTKNKKLTELESKLRKIDSKINNLTVRYNESLGSVKFMDYGNSILEHLNDIFPGQEFLEVYSGDSKTKIRLNTSASPSMNAQKYYQKYKRQKESISLLKTKIDKLKKEKQTISAEINKFNSMSDLKEIKKISKSLIKDKNPDETSKFRKFILNEDYQVWVGKDSKSNDLLTVKYTATNDLWFNIRGTSGSHTVLKTGNKNANIDKHIIETAASICAYYSKARNAGTVPVAFCLKKFIKKRKGFKEGSVVMEREKVIFVKPKLPEGFDDIS